MRLNSTAPEQGRLLLALCYIYPRAIPIKRPAYLFQECDNCPHVHFSLIAVCDGGIDCKTSS